MKMPTTTTFRVCLPTLYDFYHQVLKSLLVIGGVELNPGPKNGYSLLLKAKGNVCDSCETFKKLAVDLQAQLDNSNKKVETLQKTVTHLLRRPSSEVVKIETGKKKKRAHTDSSSVLSEIASTSRSSNAEGVTRVFSISCEPFVLSGVPPSRKRMHVSVISRTGPPSTTSQPTTSSTSRASNMPSTSRASSVPSTSRASNNSDSNIQTNGPNIIPGLRKEINKAFETRDWSKCIGIMMNHHINEVYFNLHQPDLIYSLPLKAAASGYIDIVQALVHNGLPVNKRLRDGRGPDGKYNKKTMLHCAAESGNCNLANFLISERAHIDARNGCNQTPLQVAILSSRTNMVRLLIENSADTNVSDNTGHTPLHNAVCKCDLDVAKLLIENSAEVNRSNEYGDTPLHLAAVFGHIALVRLLISSGCNLALRNESGQTALDRARSKKHTDVANILAAE